MVSHRENNYEGVLKKAGVWPSDEKIQIFVVSALANYASQICSNPDLTEPKRFKIVSEKQCEKELKRLAEAAISLRELLNNSSHSCRAALIFAQWKDAGKIDTVLGDLIDVAQTKADPKTAIGNSQGRPRKVIVGYLVDFLLRHWIAETGKVPAVNTWGGKREGFCAFVSAIFLVLEVRASAEKAAKAAIAALHP